MTVRLDRRLDDCDELRKNMTRLTRKTKDSQLLMTVRLVMGQGVRLATMRSG